MPRTGQGLKKYSKKISFFVAGDAGLWKIDTVLGGTTARCSNRCGGLSLFRGFVF
jgi:hypothetical protein